MCFLAEINESDFKIVNHEIEYEPKFVYGEVSENIPPYVGVTKNTFAEIDDEAYKYCYTFWEWMCYNVTQSDSFNLKYKNFNYEINNIKYCVDLSIKVVRITDFHYIKYQYNVYINNEEIMNNLDIKSKLCKELEDYLDVSMYHIIFRPFVTEYEFKHRCSI